MDNKEQTGGVDLLILLDRFLVALRRVWVLFLILPVLCGVFFFFRAKTSFVPLYEVKAVFTVESGYSADDILGTKMYFDQYAAQQLADSFPQLLKTDIMRDLINQNSKKGYVSGYAVAQSVVDTNMMSLSVQSTNPNDAYDYLQAIMKSYPQIAVYMVDYPQVKIIREPVVPSTPFNSFEPVSPTVKGVLLGVVLVLALALLMALSSKTFQSAEELKKVVNLPILVSLPKVDRKARRNSKKQALMEEDSNMDESLRGLRVKIKKLLEEKNGKTILFTSTISGEGKTTVAVNLAKVLVRDGKKVLVVDGDLRKQNIAQVLGQEITDTGLLSCLNDPTLDPKRLVRQAEGVDFISGASTQERHYTVNSANLRNLLDRLKEDYDYVIMDAPPCEAVSDAAALARSVDCIVYLVRQNYVLKDQLLNAVTVLHQKDVKIDGCVFNGVPHASRKYGYGYGYGYGYNYGYGYGYGYGYKKYGYGYSKYAKEQEKEADKE